MIRITLTYDAPGPHGVYRKGDTVEVADADGEQLIALGYAVAAPITPQPASPEDVAAALRASFAGASDDDEPAPDFGEES